MGIALLPNSSAPIDASARQIRNLISEATWRNPSIYAEHFGASNAGFGTTLVYPERRRRAQWACKHNMQN